MGKKCVSIIIKNTEIALHNAPPLEAIIIVAVSLAAIAAAPVGV